MIEIEDGFINVGPIPEEHVDSKVKGLIKDVEGENAVALCLSEHLLTDTNLRWAQGQFLSQPSGKVVGKVDRISNNGNRILEDPRFSKQIRLFGDTSEVDPGDTVLMRVRGPHRGIIRGDFLQIKKTTQFWEEDIRDKLGFPEIDCSDVDVDLTSEEDTEQSSNTISTSDLNLLREEAEEAAVEEVPRDVTANTQSTSQYSRSQKVREYVKARSNGVCEGCREAAPFTSKTGEPYLHAHHVNELSNGGSDTPDTVIALCPNCHYRVHHGQDGDEYNHQLRNKVKNIEG